MKADYKPFAEALYLALQQDAFYVTLENSVANPKARKAAMIAYLAFSMQEAKRYGLLHLPEDEPFGVSVWNLPQTGDMEDAMKREKMQFLETEMGPASADCYRNIVSEMSQQTATTVDPKAWYLSIVGVRPEYQNQGRGVELIRPVLQQSDALGLQTYLETFGKRNQSFYQRLGYETVAEYAAPSTGSRYWVMVRDAVTSNTGDSA